MPSLQEKFENATPLQTVKANLAEFGTLRLLIGLGFFFVALGLAVLIAVTATYIAVQLLQFNLIFAALSSVFLIGEGLALSLGVFEALGSR